MASSLSPSYAVYSEARHIILYADDRKQCNPCTNNILHERAERSHYTVLYIYSMRQAAVHMRTVGTYCIVAEHKYSTKRNLSRSRVNRFIQANFFYSKESIEHLLVTLIFVSRSSFNLFTRTIVSDHLSGRQAAIYHRLNFISEGVFIESLFVHEGCIRLS